MCAAAPVIGAVVGLLAGVGFAKAITPKAPKMPALAPPTAPQTPTQSVVPTAAPNPPVASVTVDQAPARSEPQAVSEADKQVQAARKNVDNKRQMLSQTQLTTPLGLLTQAPTTKKTLLGS